MKRIVAVPPYFRKGSINFKMGPYKAWENIGGETASSHYLFKPFTGFFHKYELPTFWHCAREARLRFMEPINRYFDAFPDYMFYEIVPFVWDCWPCLDDRFCRWIERHKVRRVVFTSEQNAERIKKRLPHLEILVVTEGIDVSVYGEGKMLHERTIDFFEFGRNNRVLFNPTSWNDIRHISTSDFSRRVSDKELRKMMGDAKTVVTLPKCDTDAEIADGVETLTQRYWEAMLSRIVMIGHAPKELVDLLGYNPCIEMEGFISHRGMSKYTIEPLDNKKLHRQVSDIISNITEYQSLVDRNRDAALRLAPWELRMRQVKEWLEKI